MPVLERGLQSSLQLEVLPRSEHRMTTGRKDLQEQLGKAAQKIADLEGSLTWPRLR